MNLFDLKEAPIFRRESRRRRGRKPRRRLVAYKRQLPTEEAVKESLDTRFDRKCLLVDVRMLLLGIRRNS